MYRQHLRYIFQTLFTGPSVRRETKAAQIHNCRLFHHHIKTFPNHSITADQVSPDFVQLKLTSDASEVRASTIWLRHHCRCSKCFNIKTNQRTQIPSSLKEKSQIKQIRLLSEGKDDGHLEILWNDDHPSTYTSQWLEENFGQGDFSERKKAAVTDQQYPLERAAHTFVQKKKTMNDRSINENPLKFGIKYKDFMNEKDNKGLIQLLSNLQNYGYGIITEAPPEVQATNEAILKISHPQSTIFGDFYEFSADMSHADTAYTSDYVHLHTDTTYFSEPIGLQVFHCLYHDGDGGMNSIVDGYQIAQEIKEENPRFYELLTHSLVPWQYVDPTKYFFYQIAPIFSHNQFTKQLECVRYNPHDMALLNTIEEDLLPEFYDGLITLSKKIESSPMWIKLQPGIILFLDNWRMFHGRNEFTGLRKMCGSYISRSDWLSKCRVLL